MRKLLAIAWADMKLQFTEKSDLIFFLILPIVFTSVLAMSMGAQDNPNADNRYPLLVVDEDKSVLSAQLIGALRSSAVVRPTVTSQTDAEQRFTKKDAYIPAIVTIPAGFGADMQNGRATTLSVRRAPSDQRVVAVEQELRTISGQMSNVVAVARVSVSEAERIRPFASESARQAYFEQGLVLAQQQLANPPARAEVKQAQQATRQNMSGTELSSAGQLVTWTMITLVAAAEVFVYERLEGTLRRMASTPTRKATILSGKMLGRLAAGLLQMTLLIAFGAIVFKLQWERSPLALAAVMIAFGLAGVSLGVLLGTFARTRSQAGWLAVMFSMLLSALGGAWWPLEITPPVYQRAVSFLPTTWAMKGFENVLVRGADLNSVLSQVSVLLLFAVVFFVVGVRRLRFE